MRAPRRGSIYSQSHWLLAAGCEGYFDGRLLEVGRDVTCLVRPCPTICHAPRPIVRLPWPLPRSEIRPCRAAVAVAMELLAQCRNLTAVQGDKPSHRRPAESKPAFGPIARRIENSAGCRRCDKRGSQRRASSTVRAGRRGFCLRNDASSILSALAAAES
jgi:hypothetical protein